MPKFQTLIPSFRQIIARNRLEENKMKIWYPPLKKNNEMRVYLQSRDFCKQRSQLPEPQLDTQPVLRPSNQMSISRNTEKKVKVLAPRTIAKNTARTAPIKPKFREYQQEVKVKKPESRTIVRQIQNCSHKTKIL